MTNPGTREYLKSSNQENTGKEMLPRHEPDRSFWMAAINRLDALYEYTSRRAYMLPKNEFREKLLELADRNRHFLVSGVGGHKLNLILKEKSEEFPPQAIHAALILYAEIEKGSVHFEDRNTGDEVTAQEDGFLLYKHADSEDFRENWKDEEKYPDPNAGVVDNGE